MLTAGANKKSNHAEFAFWLSEQQQQNEQAESSTLKENIWIYGLEVEISTLVICLNRYSRLLIKKVLINYPQLVSEDFTYLYPLIDVEGMTKNAID